MSWTRRLHDISFLPPGVLDLVGAGKLGASIALELLPLKDEAILLEVAGQCVEWKYTATQARIRVFVLLNPPAAPEPGSLQFNSEGKPSRVPIPCFCCREDLGDVPPYVWLCGACQGLVTTFYTEYTRASAAPPTPPEG